MSFQSLCLETKRWSIVLHLRVRHRNSVTPPHAMCPFQLSQSETSVQSDKSNTHTCSGQLSPMEQLTPGPSVSRTNATRITLITWPSMNGWRSCKCFTPPRITVYPPECCWRRTPTPHTCQTENTSALWTQHRPHPQLPCHVYATWDTKREGAGRWCGRDWPELGHLDSWSVGLNLRPFPHRDNILWSSRALGSREGRGESYRQQQEGAARERQQGEWWVEQRGTQFSYGQLCSIEWQTWTCLCYPQDCREKLIKRASSTVWTTDRQEGSKKNTYGLCVYSFDGTFLIHKHQYIN